MIKSSRILRVACIAATVLTSAIIASAAIAGPSAPASQRYTWRSVQIVGGGFVDGFVFSPCKPDLIYARTDIGGPYRWDARAKRWIPLTDWVGQANGNWRGTEALAVDPTDPNRVYAAAGTYSNQPAAILRSTDQGRTWQAAQVPFTMGGNEDGRSIGERMQVDPNKPSILYYGTRHDGLWKSTDYAASWTKVDSFPNVVDTTAPSAVPPPIPGSSASPSTARPNTGFFRGYNRQGDGVGIVVFDPRSKGSDGSSQTIYVATDAIGQSDSLYRSTDGGATWTAVAGQPQNLLPHHAVLASDGTMYVSYGNSVGPSNMTDGAVWKLNTATGDWTDITPVKPGGDSVGGYAGLSVDAQHPGTVMVATLDWFHPGDEIYRSIDAGAHWTALSAISVRDASNSPWLNWGRGKTSFGWWFGALAIDPFHSGRVFYGTGATIWGTQDVTNADSGKTVHWTVWAKGIEETAALDLISLPEGPHLISGLGDIGGFRHDNLDETPQAGMFTNPVFNNTNSLDFAQSNPALVVRVGTGDRNSPHGAYSLDSGATWTPFAAEPEGSRGSGSVAVTADGKSIIWAASGGATAYSIDKGTTWTVCTGLPTPPPPPAGGGYYFGRNNPVRVFADRVDPNAVYAVDGSTTSLYLSMDGGATFIMTNASLPSGAGSDGGRTTTVINLRVSPDAAGNLWIAAGAGGLYHSTDFGATFKPVSSAPTADGLGFGAAAPGQPFSALYLVGAPIAGVHGVYRSDDDGASWIRINDDQHQYGWIGIPVIGDPRIYGRVYLGTNGRGILYADPAQ